MNLKYHSIQAEDAESIKHHEVPALERLMVYQQGATTWQTKPLYISTKVSRTDTSGDVTMKISFLCKCDALDFTEEFATELKIYEGSPEGVIAEIVTINGKRDGVENTEGATLEVRICQEDEEVVKRVFPLDFKQD